MAWPSSRARGGESSLARVGSRSAWAGSRSAQPQDVVPTDRHPSAIDGHPSAIDRHPSPIDRHPSPFDRHPSPIDRPPSPIDGPPSPIDGPPSPIDRPPSPIDRPPSPIDRPPSPIDGGFASGSMLASQSGTKASQIDLQGRPPFLGVARVFAGHLRWVPRSVAGDSEAPFEIWTCVHGQAQASERQRFQRDALSSPPLRYRRRSLCHRSLDAMQDGNEYGSIVSLAPKNPDIVPEIRRAVAELEAVRGRRCAVYAANQISDVRDTGIRASDHLPFCEMVGRIPASEKKLDIFIATPGGSAEQVNLFVEALRPRFDAVDFLVPYKAMSAGTLWALSGDRIWMDDRAFLGPLDPPGPDQGRHLPTCPGACRAPARDPSRRAEALKKNEQPPWAFIQLLNVMDQRQLGAALSVAVRLTGDAILDGFQVQALDAAQGRTARHRGREEETGRASSCYVGVHTSVGARMGTRSRGTCCGRILRSRSTTRRAPMVFRERCGGSGRCSITSSPRPPRSK